MYTRLLNRWDTIRNSFWFLPGIMSLGAFLLALGCTWLDGPIEEWLIGIAPWIGVSTNAARASLAAISSAMVSIAGIVFSVMLVTLSITSSQYGSRLLRTFMSDTVTQSALGMLVGTSLFAMIALAGIQDTHDRESAANVSVVVGLLLAIASLAVLIGFIHHVACLIQAPNVVAAVACDLDASLDRLFPEHIGDHQEESDGDDIDFEMPEVRSGTPVKSKHEGYLQAIDTETLLQLAKSHQLFLRLRVKPGEFIERGQVLLELWPDEVVSTGPSGETAKAAGHRMSGTPPDYGDELTEKVNDTIIAGPRRTPRQDAECALDELVEVAVRALSPGINDPFTAMSCLDRIAASLGRAAERKMPNPFRFDDEGTLRIHARATSFDHLMDAGFNQIRQHGCQCVAVSIQMLSALMRIADRVCDETQRTSVRRHANMLKRDFREHVSQPEDGDDFQRKYDELDVLLTSRAVH